MRTKTFGLSPPTGLTKRTTEIPADLVLTGSNSEYLKGNYPIREISEDAYFAIYNFGVNLDYNVGMDDSKVPGISALKFQTLDAFIPGLTPVGITGLLDKATNQLLGVNFILARRNDIVIDAARLCMREYGFRISEDLSILNPIPLFDQANVYGLSAQARFGDNTTQKPDMLDLIENVKWDNWNKYKGMDP